MNRTASSLQMKSPIVEFLTPDASKTDEKEVQPADLFDISIHNVINNSSWKLTDILFATPVTLSHILQ